MKLRKDGDGFILSGVDMPKHIQVAYGRYLFKLRLGKDKVGLWLRDLPLNLWDLAREYGYGDALKAYQAECDRVGIVDYSAI